MDRHQRLRDPVHGLITFKGESLLDQLAWRLIDTPEFQRLRRIKQLGVSEFVFPSATHTRFAHSVGVFHTARTLIEVIQREVGKDFNRERADVAVIAALLHDIGHGPFSHTFEAVQKARGVSKRHELWTADIIRHSHNIYSLLSEYRADGKFGDEIAEMLEAEDPIDIYHAVVSSSFDADRLDYLRRDRLMTGTLAGAIDFDWLLEHVRIRPVAIEAADPDDDDHPSPVQTFCLDLKALPSAEQFLLARYTLHEQVYFHKTTRCVESLIATLLGRLATLASSGKKTAASVGLFEKHPVWRFFRYEDPPLDAYLGLDDAVLISSFDLMVGASDPAIADLASRLRERRLYKTLDLRSLGHDEGRQNQWARRIDNTLRNGNFRGKVNKDEGAKIGIYTQIGGDDERTHKKLHILDPASGPREITQFSALIRALAPKQQFTRYYFENDADRQAAKQSRKAHD